MKIKNIFFDFDGVIADSVNVKTIAFEKLYLPFGKEISAKVVEHHKNNGGMSRFEKFKHYHNEFLGIKLDENGIEKLSNEFSLLVKNGVINSKEVNGAHSFLKEFQDKLNMFVITGTPTEESIEINKTRGIFNCFKGIFGSPQKKGAWCKYIFEHFEVNPKETIFVGDAMADYDAAKENNLPFFLRENEDNRELFKDVNDIIRFNDFEDFRKLINDL